MLICEPKRIYLFKNHDEIPYGVMDVDGWVIVSNQVSAEIFPKRTSVIIKNKANNKKIFRISCGAGARAGITSDSIVLDYDGFKNLGIETPKKNQFTNVNSLLLKEANMLEITLWYFNHPLPFVKLATRIAFLSLALSFVSFFV